MLLERFKVSQRRACQVVLQDRATQRYLVSESGDENCIREKVIFYATQYGRYGTPRVTALIRREGTIVNHKRVERIWREEGLKVPKKQPKKRRLWLNDGSCIRKKPEYKNHVWSYDFVSDETHDKRPFRMLNIIDEYTRECLTIKCQRRLTAMDVLETLSTLFIMKGVPDYIRSDNGPEFVAKILRNWLQKVGVKTLYIEPGSPWENGYVESFNGKFRDEFLNGEIFYTLKEAKILTEKWRRQYNTIRPHSSLNFRPPVPEAVLPNYAKLAMVHTSV